MTITRLPQDRCPVCEKDLDATTSIDHDSKPTTGDITVCLYCASFLMFNNNLTLRLITEQEMGDPSDTNREILITSRRIING